METKIPVSLPLNNLDVYIEELFTAVEDDDITKLSTLLENLDIIKRRFVNDGSLNFYNKIINAKKEKHP